MGGEWTKTKDEWRRGIRVSGGLGGSRLGGERVLERVWPSWVRKWENSSSGVEGNWDGKMRGTP